MLAEYSILLEYYITSRGGVLTLIHIAHIRGPKHFTQAVCFNKTNFLLQDKLIEYDMM